MTHHELTDHLDAMPLRTYDSHGNPICVCNERTNAVYRNHPVLTCWSCGRLMGAINEREKTTMLATINAVLPLAERGALMNLVFGKAVTV